MADDRMMSQAAPLLDLPDGYTLGKDAAGRWDVVVPDGFDWTNEKNLAELTDLKRQLEESLSPPPVPRDQAAPPAEPELDMPWLSLDPGFILECMGRNVTGDAELYAAMHKDKVAINITTGGDKKTPETLEFTGHHWRMDESGVYAYSLVENVAMAYWHAHQVTTVSKFKAAIEDKHNELLHTAAEADQKILRGDIDSLEKQLAERTKGVSKRIYSLRAPTRESSVITKARSIAGFPLNCRSSWLDNRPNLLPVANGIIDLETGDFRPGRPDDWMVRAAPVEWRGADFDRAAWEKFLWDVYTNPEIGEPEPDLIPFIQRLAGYALLGATPDHILPILTGRGRNGKSTFLNTLYWTLGPLACGLPSELLLDQGVSRSADSPTPSIMSLKGLRLAWASETAEGRKFSIERVKWLTGGDPLTGRHPNDKYPTTFDPTHLMFLLTNNLPSAPATDYAFWKRVLAIPHRISFVHGEPTQVFERPIDKSLESKLAACLPGVLAWLVEGHMAWRAYGLCPPAVVTEATDKYREGEDTLGEFLFECCEIGDGLRVGSSKLYSVFEEWYHKRAGKFPPAQKKFGNWMNDKGFERQKSGTIHYLGLDLKMEHQDGFHPEE
ncbi:DNA primase family protein [Desulfovibrio caledoniensis]